MKPTGKKRALERDLITPIFEQILGDPVILSFYINLCVRSVTVERKKETLSDSLDKQQKKKIEREEERLKNNNRDMSFVKMKSMLAIGFVFTALLGMFNSM